MNQAGPVTTDGAIKRQKDDLPAGTRIGRYELEEPVGRGGMGTVYKTFDPKTNRNVALKLLAPGIPPSLRDRFLAECEAEANIRHENVMPVYDRGWLNDERPYFVMELLYEPITLGEIIEHIQKGTLGQAHPRLRHWNDLRRLIADVLVPIFEGVAVANVEYGVQHRDLKPDNVLIDIRTRRAYLIDFGICRDMDEADEVGKIVGTPRFLSPEQAAGRTDPRTDVWGLGALLRYAITNAPPLAGTSPFSRKDVADRIAALTKAEAEAKAAGQDAKARGYANRREQLEDPTLRVHDDLMRDANDGIYLPLPDGVSASLRAIIDKAMATDPEDRYTDAAKLVADLRTWLQGGGVQALSEQGKRGAVLDWARRHLNRNVVRGVGTGLALLLGWVVGTGMFQTTPPPPDYRLEDATAALAEVERAGKATVPSRIEDAAPAVGLLLEQGLLRHRRAATQARLAALETADGGTPAERPSTVLPTRGVLRLEGWKTDDYAVDDLAHLPESGESMKGARGSFFPGAYQVYGKSKAGFFLRFVVPPVPGLGFDRGEGNDLERVVRLGSEPAETPSGMTWVPAGLVAPGDDRVLPAFVAGVRAITNERYSEWLDDLPPKERARRVPATGFQRDERDPRRYLVVSKDAMRPVVGVKPEDAAAYARWRSEVEGIPLRLPTALEWQRMAGIDQMAQAGADPIFPWRRAPSRRTAQRRGEAPQDTGADVSPYGVRGLYAGGGEIVTGSEAGTFAIKGDAGILPLVSAVKRAAPIAAGAAQHTYGFRLVYGN
ncbi:MAG: bifunctional serine/threonine-protein kinase/formylglycine-generating enzyme family protein [Planctomycetota bacterium]|nr:bifunctional serine/threonine-protein kinase/formylglycine-generating enzyme family protein [Planctomycetota bacterium]